MVSVVFLGVMLGILAASTESAPAANATPPARKVSVLSQALLGVEPDTSAPTLLNAASTSTNRVLVRFSEPVDPAEATRPTHYKLDRGVSVIGAAAGSDPQSVVLTTSPLVFGVGYTLRVSGIPDLAVPPNVIVADSMIGFTALEFLVQSVGAGNRAQIRRLTPLDWDLSGSGPDFGGTTDGGVVATQARTGDFDLQVRVEGVDVSNPFLHAGLMARAGTDPRAPFAAVFAGSTATGCFFESRETSGGAARQQAPSGGFPVNYPQAWLRLRRVGDTFTGFAGFDGRAWVQLGVVTVPLGATVDLGLAVTSADANTALTARFRDFGPTASTTTRTFVADAEPLWPSSRRTGIVLSEIMYHPRALEGVTNRLEFVELYNAGAIFEDLGEWRLGGDIDFTFPRGFRLEAGQFVVVAADPVALSARSGARHPLGPFTGSLNNAGGTVRLHDNTGAVKLEVHFQAEAPWPIAADGAGHSLVLARPSYGEDSPEAWRASERIGGSPGEIDTRYPNPWSGVVLNEFLAHTDLPQLDYVELYNPSNAEIDLSDCVVTDDASTNRFQIPAGTRIPARGFLAFDEVALGFRLNAAGEDLFLLDPGGTRVLDSLRFAAQENGVASGRWPDGARTIRRLARPTPGAANGAWRQEPVVISELMYEPISRNDDDQFIEIYNRSPDPVDLSGWKFVAGVDFTFPAGARLAPGGYAVVARDRERLLARQPEMNAAAAYGNFSGALRHGGERIALAMPDTIVSTNALGDLETNRIHIAVAEVTYGSGGRWGHWAAGGGSSLELMDANADPLQASNWADSDESAKGQWSEFVATGRLDLGQGTPNRLHLTMQGEGECLVDDLEVSKAGSTNVVRNPGFEEGITSWNLFGNHSLSSLETSGAHSGANALRVRGQGDGDTGINAIRGILGSGLASGNTVTIRAWVRWVAGWPEVLFRLHGSWFELPAQLVVPTNLGTPGRANSRAVPNAGPAIYEVAHSPALPAADARVLVTCRVSDPQALTSLVVRYRVDPNANLSALTLRDDGLSGDAVAGDGIFSASLSGRAAGTLVGFRIEATDVAGATRVYPEARALWPVPAGAPECLVRWGDPIPVGSLPHYHLWNTQGVEARRRAALDNTYRDCTVVYGDRRIIYNAGFRDKGSPFHGGSGDYSVKMPDDDRLLGVTERVLAATGNGGEEDTQLRGQVADWIGRSLGIPFLHRQYVHGFRNGNRWRNVLEDLEEPNRDYAQAMYPDYDGGDLYKIAIWFEFSDDNANFASTGATLESFRTTGSAYKAARYRWNWQRRPGDDSANNLTNIFDLVTAANASVNLAQSMQDVADMEEWMRLLGYHRVTGNWDSWGYNIGQNMFLYRPTGGKWVLMPWDIDFVLGLGDSATSPISGGQDPRLNVMFSNPTFRRMLWRLYQDAINGPMLPENYGPQIAARRAVLRNNGVNASSSTNAIFTYLNARRRYLGTQMTNADAKVFALSTNGGADFTNDTASVVLTGTAPFAVAKLMVNEGAYPITWSDATHFSLTVPLTRATNQLSLVGLDLRGQPVPGAAQSVTVYYPGVIEEAAGVVVINEIQYHPALPNASFVELYNRSATTSFDLTGWRLEGVGYTFPSGAVLAPNAYLILAADRAGFAAAYGGRVLVFDEFPGSLDNGGETLRLVRPGPDGIGEIRVSDVRYDNRAPWPAAADGQGPSLQLIDPSLDTWRPANWMATAAGDPSQATPGRANAWRQSLASFPSVWINEVLPNNLDGPTDNAGVRSPFIELYNSGTNTVELAGLGLSAQPTNLVSWPFPAEARLAPGAFLVVWADGQTAKSVPGAWHTSFRLDPTNGWVGLTRVQGSPATTGVLDYVEYRRLPAGRSLGSYPDGEPRRRRSLFQATAGAPNDPRFPEVQVRLNEVLAENVTVLRNTATGNYDDWFELHNGGTNTVDLTSYSLTDDPADPAAFVIPPGYVLPPGGFLLVWADGKPSANSATNAELHTNFKLAKSGDELALFGPDGKLVDRTAFGAQIADVSIGRFPDGADVPFEAMASPSPAESNVMAGANLPPVVDSIPDASVLEGSPLRLTVVAQDPDPGQSVSYSLGADAPPGATLDRTSGAFAWTPGEAFGPGTYVFTVRATDNGSPARTGSRKVRVTVGEANQAPVLAFVPDQAVGEGELLDFALTATDPDLPANALTYSLDPGAPEGLTVGAEDGVVSWLPQEDQGPAEYFVTVRVTDGANPPLAASRTFRIVVREVDNPPVFSPLQPVTVDEGSTLTLDVHATDPDPNPVSLTYSLEGNPPVGLALDSVTGRLTWTPDETAGPGTYPIVVRATENDAQQLSTAETFGIIVNEVNRPPALNPIPDLRANEGDLVRVTVLAVDPDLPVQALSFSLGPGAPAGAEIDSVTGVLSWLVPEDYGNRTNELTVLVTDAPVGDATSSTVFRVVVHAVPHVAINEIMYRPSTNGAEYVELVNYSAVTAVDLTGVRLLGGALQWAFPERTQIPPLGYLCVARDPAVFRRVYGAAVPVLGGWTGNLGRDGDDLRVVLGASPETLLDRVRYGVTAPWPELGTNGVSLQVIDPHQDTFRVGNWTAAGQGAAPRWQRVVSTGTASSSVLYLYLENAGDVYLDDVRLVAGNDPEVGPNLLANGDFEGAFPGPFVVSPNLSGSALSTSVRHSGTASLHLVSTSAGTTRGSSVYQELATPLEQNAAYVLSYWYLPNSNGGTLTLRLSGSGIKSTVNTTPGTVVLAPATPGSANSVAEALPTIPRVWISEVVPDNRQGLADRTGVAEPWLEVVNLGTEPVPLAGWFLSPTYFALGSWAFPRGGFLEPGESKVIFLDGQTSETTASEWHASFRVDPASGVLALSREQLGALAVVDYLEYDSAKADQAVGHFRDALLDAAIVLPRATPGALNPASDEFLAPTMSARWLDATTLRVSWDARPGAVYRLESTDALGSTWQALAELTATAARVDYDDRRGRSGQRYYRVLVR